MRRVAPWIVVTPGAALALAGAVVFAVADRSPQDVGWSSYAPLGEDVGAYQSSLTLTFDDGWAVLWTGRHVVGAGLIGLGLLLLVGAAGRFLGLRAGRRSPRT